MKQNTYLLFLKKLLFIVSIIFILDLTVGKLLEFGYYKQKSGVDYETTYVIQKNKSDILILGSSRANHHYVPSIFIDSLKLSYYNAGRDGNFIFYHKTILECVLNRYKPKLVILDFNNGEFELKQSNYDRLKTLLPYYAKYKPVRETLQLKGYKERLKLISNIYPYNSLIFPIIRGIIGKEKKSQVSELGFIPLHKIWQEPIKYNSNYDPTLDNNTITYFSNIIKLCKTNNIDLICVVSPVFMLIEKDKSTEIAKQIAAKNSIPFIDFSKDKYFLSHRDLFEDQIHLNQVGASAFSKKLVGLIKKDL